MSLTPETTGRHASSSPSTQRWRLAPELSERLKLARVLCLMCVLYVHMPPYNLGAPDDLLSPDGLALLVREGVGRSSVPLLSIVSGFLLLRLAGTKSWSDQIWRKVGTLLFPLAIWSALDIAKDMAVGGWSAFPAPYDITQSLFGIVGYPQNGPLYFLRDVFVCALVSPILVAMLTRAKLLVVPFFVLNAVCDLDRAIFTNSAIPLFFTVGLAFAMDIVPTVGRRTTRIAAVIAACVMVGYAVLPFYAGELWMQAPDHAWILRGIQVIDRVAGAVLFWLAAGAVMRSRTAAGRVAAFEPAMFFVFCSHTLVLGAWWTIVHSFGVRVGDAAYLGFFLSGPLVVLAAAMAVMPLLSMACPKVLSYMIGGRVPTADQYRAMVSAVFPRAPKSVRP